MRAEWISQNPEKPLRLFFSGFGTEPDFFRFLEAEDENLMLIYDYTDFDLPPELKKIFEDQRSVEALGWSMGVWVLGFFQNRFAPESIFGAINGTLYPIHDHFGILPEIYEATLTGFNEAGQEKFFRRMFSEKKEAERFLSGAFTRSVRHRGQELQRLKNQILNSPENPSRFQGALISEKDRIIPTRNQRAFWGTHQETRVRMVPDEGHFCFYAFQSWNELFERIF